MKVWVKLLISSVVGLLLGIFLPFFGKEVPAVLVQVGDFILSLGRYALFPLIFFSTAMAVDELRREKRLWRLVVRSVSYTLIISLALVLLGALLILLFNPEAIPLASRHESALIFKSWNETLIKLVPKNAFEILTGGSDFLLPIYALSFFLGLHFHFDRTITQPTVSLFNSLSRIFYHMNTFLVEILSWGVLILSAAWLTQLRLVQNIQLYTQVFVVLTLATAVTILGIIPLILYFFGGRVNPYKWVFAMLSAGLAGFFSGDSFFSLSFVTRMTHENLGVPRKVGGMNLPLFAMFGRAGTAMTSTIAFFVILKSYTSYEITIDQIVWTVAFAFLLSFALPSVPSLGAYINLSLLCASYGKALDTGYINLQPILPVLVSFAALVDVYTAGLTSFLVAKHEGMVRDVSPKAYQ